MNNINEIIKNCNKCGNLPKLHCNSIKLGNSNLLILGESPAKDGWIVSGKAFYNKDGKLQATGKPLNKLLNICNLSIDDINFTEVCKCIIEDRKTLSKCSNNYKDILFKQLENIDCDIIMPMGKYPTETILGRKINKLADIVGIRENVKIGNTTKIVIPIFHTSPANPKCFLGNEPIFNKLKNDNLIKNNTIN